jgi:hypothetical protein
MLIFNATRGEEVPTEDLRVALMHYREFFERLLAVQRQNANVIHLLIERQRVVGVVDVYRHLREGVVSAPRCSP